MGRKSPFVFVLVAFGLAPPALASFHIMQIEQVVATGSTAQAIQLRMRSGGQNQVQFARLRAWSADGATITPLVDLTTPVAQAGAGARVLIATPAFAAANPDVAPDFLMQPIPANALSAGRITFEDDGGPILWSLCWGGTGYTGPTTGGLTNDSDGNFGPCVGDGLPLDGRGIRFTGAAAAASTSNIGDYEVTAQPAIVTNNAGRSAPAVGLFADDFEDAGTLAAGVAMKAAAAANAAPPADAHDHGAGFVSEARAAGGR